MKNLKETFEQLVCRYCNDTLIANKLWLEIEKNYSNKKRHYHNLTHLHTLIKELEQHQDKVDNWDTILFSIFYHDIIYNVLKHDNEEKSAILATEKLKQINFPKQEIENCYHQIIATKAHAVSINNDINIFTDADLCILGKDLSTYKNYTLQIRKEYSIYPDFMYKPGRKKVIEHFLAMDSIFKTDAFLQQYETQALINLSWELSELS